MTTPDRTQPMTRRQALHYYHQAVWKAVEYTEETGKHKAAIQELDRMIEERETAAFDNLKHAYREVNPIPANDPARILADRIRTAKERNVKRKELISACQWAKDQALMMSGLANALSPLAFQPSPIERKRSNNADRS